ncbi:MAG: hypothetical protein KDA24_26515 [Deltaproteobacteria bacterium]|nr:hypothetical protein [Deltaproteobacteria bacterium]
MRRTLVLLSTLGVLASSGCVDPSSLEGLVVALAPSTPDHFNIQPIIVKAPRNDAVKFRYEWTTDNPDFSGENPMNWGEIVGSWATFPGDTWTVSVIPYVGRLDAPLAEGPAAEGVTIISDAGRDTDNDGDGSTENQGDCDDTNAQIFPGVDRDNDGFPGCNFQFAGGQPADCDDNDSQVNPGRNFDGDDTRFLIDDDCDGLVDEDAINAGDFVITEVMAESATPGGEWIEILHLGTSARQLVGWQLRSGDTEQTLPPAQVASSDFFVLCPNPAVAVGLGVDCANAASFSAGAPDSEVLGLSVPETASGTEVLQQIPLSELPFAVGVSAQLTAGSTASAAAAEDSSAWCASAAEFGDEFGTPGAGNEECL